MFGVLTKLFKGSDEIEAPVRRRKVRSDKGFARRRRGGGKAKGQSVGRRVIQQDHLFCRKHDRPHNIKSVAGQECRGNYVVFPYFYTHPNYRLGVDALHAWQDWQYRLLREEGWGKRTKEGAKEAVISE